MKRIALGAAGLVLGLATGGASAQDGKNWPDKPVHIVGSLTAGSATDAMARLVAARLSEQLAAGSMLRERALFDKDIAREIASSAQLVMAAGIPICGAR
jgi:tripartite-type tricarboxylate transporter receptor subunit TctC